MTTLLDHLQRALRGDPPAEGAPLLPAPIASLLGFEMVAVSAGEATLAFEAGPQHRSPMGALHGGVLADLADLAMGIAMGTVAEEGERFTTVELRTSFLRPIWCGRVSATARVVHRGATLSLLECDLLGPEGKLAARASCTMMRIEGDKARGR